MTHNRLRPRSVFLSAVTAAAVIAGLHSAAVLAPPSSGEERSKATNGNGPFRDATADLPEVTVDGSRSPDTDGVIWSYDIVGLGSRYVRLYFDQIKSPVNSTYWVKIFDQDLAALIADYSPQEFSLRGEFFTSLLPGRRLQVRLVASSPQPGLQFRLKAVVRERPDATPIPQQAGIRYYPVISYPPDNPIRKVAAPAVALIHLGTPPIIEACTGTLVRSDLIATSFHCMASSSSFSDATGDATKMCAHEGTRACTDVMVEFDVLKSDGGVGTVTQCREVVAYDRTEDFVVLRIDPQNARSPVELESLSSTDKDGQAILLHHPLGFPMMVDDSCKFRGLRETDLYHNCDTEAGSSGAPLFDREMHWVGTHYRGPYPDNWTGKEIQDYNKEVLAGNRPPAFSHARAAETIMACALAH